MVSTAKHKWTFRARFRRNTFGWKSSKLAVKRIKEAVAEIKKVARKDSVLGAEGVVIFLEKLSPAIEQVDSSSGSLGTAVHNAIEVMIPTISKTDINNKTREQWLNRLWQAIEDDEIPYLENLSDNWGKLCTDPLLASKWADYFIGTVRSMWLRDSQGYSHFKGTISCFSCLYSAGRYDEIMDLLKIAPFSWWHYRRWGVKALFAMGKKTEALQYAEESHGVNENPVAITTACEEILISSGMLKEAYKRYAIEANQKSTYLATFRAIAKKYPGKKAGEVLNDLVESTPGEEGKWFAAAKSVELYDDAIALANRTPCDPRTLTRASRDFVDKEPEFAVNCGLSALRWILAGYGYEISGNDVLDAFDHTVKAATGLYMEEVVMVQIKEMIDGVGENKLFVRGVLERRLR